uniref:Major facilitator superfamily (MFS) profile domain-containing protein n=1 Tax=Homalodisca liturata TaxID=320908 RepID=A0A1B6J995_9HEMI
MSFIEIENEERRKLLSGGIQANYGDVIIHSPSPTRGSTVIEPVLLMFLLAKTLSDTVITNLLEYRTCRVLLELPHDNCTDPVSPNVEDLVQPTTAHIITGRALLEAFVPSCMAVLIGPWSDANGRKPFMVISLAGISLTYFCWGCLSLLPNLHPYVFLLASLPMSLSGGSCAVYLLTYCYISDVTDEHTRSFRFSVIVVAEYCSMIIGTALGDLMVTFLPIHDPYFPVFFLSALLLMLIGCYTHWAIKESVDIQVDKKTRLFTFDHVSHLLSAAVKRRNGFAREMIFIIIISYTLGTFMNEGENTITYLFVREKFSWQLTEYTEFNCFTRLTLGLGTLVGVWLLSTVLGLSNMLAVTLLFTSYSLRSFLMAESTNSAEFYMAATVGSFVWCHSPLIRAELSCLVPKHDIGKMFAVAAFLQSLSPMASTPLYTSIYEFTFRNKPGAVFMFSCFLSAVNSMLTAFVFIGQKLVGDECYNTESPPEQIIENVD